MPDDEQETPRRRRTDTLKHYLVWGVGIVLMVISTNWAHHLVIDQGGNPGGWYVWAFIFTVFIMGLFMAFPTPARDIIQQLRSAVPILREPEEEGQADG